MTHKALAQHYFLDSLDLHARFQAHWASQPRKSSRVKSFVDLQMACECILKSKCVMAKQDLPLEAVYTEVKNLSHNISKLASLAQQAYPSEANLRADEYFGKFNVRLRYSVEAYEYFFPVGRRPLVGQLIYANTLGNADWINEANAVVEELLEWGKTSFNGEVGDEIEVILVGQAEIEASIKPPGRKERRSKTGAESSHVPD